MIRIEMEASVRMKDDFPTRFFFFLFLSSMHSFSFVHVMSQQPSIHPRVLLPANTRTRTQT